MPETAELANFSASLLSSTTVITHPDSPTRTGLNGGPPVQAYNALDITHDPAGNVLTQESVRWEWVIPQGASYGHFQIAPAGHNWTWTTYDANNRARVIQQHVRGATPVLPQTTYTEMWYDALGRRVLMRFRTDSTSCYNPPVDSTVVACQQAITRFSWDGDQLLRESRNAGGWQLSGAALDGSVAPGTWYGTRRYTQTGSVDTPLLLWLNDAAPRAIARNWRGSAAGAKLVSTGASDRLSYPAARVSVQFELDARMSAPPPTAWLGSLIDEQRDTTGLLYRRNRYYDPATGRFTQEDPIGLAGGMNLYGYADGDPINNSDPFGLCPVRPGCPRPVRPGLFMGAALSGIGRAAEPVVDRLELRARATMGTFAAEATATTNGTSSRSVRLEASSSALSADVGLVLNLQQAQPGDLEGSIAIGGLVQAEVSYAVGGDGTRVTGIAVTVGGGLGRTSNGKSPKVGGAVAVPGASVCSGTDCE